MRTEEYHAETVLRVFQEQKVATMDELQRALNTTTRMTVIRKLRGLGYVTSYSHGAMFYALHRIAQFNEDGLWNYGGIMFSVYGTLTQTVEEFVNRSDAGLFVFELDWMLKTSTKKALQRLVKRDAVARKWLSGAYLWLSIESKKRTEQLQARQILDSGLMIGTHARRGSVSIDQIKAATILFLALLDENERRLYAGLESLKWGYGGDSKIAGIFGMDPHTVAKGREQLQVGNVEINRVRQKGAGRPKKKRMS